ncbi:hypothetical protein PtA15_16A282 [Puccinia triticina]|uniref:Uncharacterized protein n=1 Tax=Puccinia triticina TaxID=208348 RepID=A0ABY7D8L9_9BASI|nr:uncharacterized protein PtA15_16A282 [Puccinia triticina]WAQ92375.1 hypothetical protein PtA15_16A282 [Puccinia triticina]WAR64112.1 hypothetical protein PtB15_16B272 [Puccinia triticina]
MTLQWPRSIIVIGMVLSYIFSPALATPPFITGTRVRETPELKPDAFEHSESLKPQRKKRKTLADQEIHNSILHPHSAYFYSRDDPIHRRARFISPHDQITEGGMGPALSNPWELVTESIGSPSGTSVNLRSVNDADAYEEPIEQTVNQKEKSNSVLEEHSKAEPIGNKFGWHTLAELYNSHKYMWNIHALAVKRLKIQDSQEYATVNQKYIKLIDQEWYKIKNMRLMGYKLLDGLPIQIAKIVRLDEPEGAPEIHEYQIRLTKNKNLISTDDLRGRVIRIVKALGLYHNLLRLGGLEMGGKHEDLLEWFFTALFKETDTGGWPLLGQITRHGANPTYFGGVFKSEAQKLLLDVLRADKVICKEVGLQAAIALIGFWHEESALGLIHTAASTTSPHLRRPFDKEIYEREAVNALQNNHYSTTQQKLDKEARLHKGRQILKDSLKHVTTAGDIEFRS